MSLVIAGYQILVPEPQCWHKVKCGAAAGVVSGLAVAEVSSLEPVKLNFHWSWAATASQSFSCLCVALLCAGISEQLLCNL